MNKSKWFLNGGRGSGKSIRLLCETYENKIAELEKENAFIKGRNKGFELQIMGLLIKYEEVYKRFPDLKSSMEKAEAILKENAELKEELKKWKDEWQEQVQEATDEGYARTLQTMQLTKAKELIERLLKTSCNSDVLILLPNCSEVLRVRAEAEQFLKDSEVEK